MLEVIVPMRHLQATRSPCRQRTAIGMQHQRLIERGSMGAGLESTAQAGQGQQQRQALAIMQTQTTYSQYLTSLTETIIPIVG